MRINAHSQIIHDRLADLGRQDDLDSVQRGGQCRHADQAARQPGQEGQISNWQGIIDDGAQQERRQHRDGRCNQDQGDKQNNPGAIGREQGKHAAK